MTKLRGGGKILRRPLALFSTLSLTFLILLGTPLPGSAQSIAAQSSAHCNSAIDNFTTAMFCQLAAEEYALDADDSSGGTRELNLYREARCLVIASLAFKGIGQAEKARNDNVIARRLLSGLISEGSSLAGLAKGLLALMNKE